MDTILLFDFFRQHQGPCTVSDKGIQVYGAGVADVLGHKNVNTTRKHYAAMKEENKRKAANIVQLREKE